MLNTLSQRNAFPSPFTGPVDSTPLMYIPVVAPVPFCGLLARVPIPLSIAIQTVKAVGAVRVKCVRRNGSWLGSHCVKVVGVGCVGPGANGAFWLPLSKIVP